MSGHWRLSPARPPTRESANARPSGRGMWSALSCSGPFLTPLEVATAGQRRGLRLFAVGTLLYVLAWVLLMIAPESPWSTSWLGFVAPAYTPLVWLTGLGLIGRRLYVPSPYRRWMYVALVCSFVAFHVTHTSIVYARNYHIRRRRGVRSDD
jgi:hypothetical protein